MTGLGDALKGAYSAAEASARARFLDPRHTITSIRRRRTARAVGTGTATVAGVAAVGAVWWLGPGGGSVAPAGPPISPDCTVWPYVPPNMASFGDAPFLYRAYVDLRPDSPDPKVVVVLADGTATVLEPNSAGDYVYTIDGHEEAVWWHDYPASFNNEPTVVDYADWGGGGDVWDGVSPYTRDYAWTMVVPSDVPEGINTAALSSTLRIVMGMGGTGYLTDSVPEGAVTDAIVTTKSGATEVTRLKDGDPGPSLEDRDDVASVALRVSGLPDGETFTITATYDPSGIPAPTCAADEQPLTTFTPAPTSGDESASPEGSPSASEPPLFGSSPSPSATPSATPAPSQG